MKIKTDFKLFALVLVSTEPYALDLLFKPDFAFKERYEDNLRMQAKPIRSNFISTISPGLLFGYLADNSEFKTNFKWNQLIYHGDSDLDFAEKILNLNHQYKSELFRTDVLAGYAEESSINTQLEVAGSGDVQTQVPRTTKFLTPSVTYNLNAKNAVQIGYSYSDVAFERQDNLQNSLRYSDYTNQQLSGTFMHSYSERLNFNLTGAYSVFESANESPGFIFGIIPVKTGFSQKSMTFSYQAGFQYLFDEQTQLNFSAGIRDTTTDASQYNKLANSDLFINQTTNSSDTIGHVFSTNLTRKAEWGDFFISAGQQLNPASTGSQQTTTSFSGRARYNLDERWLAGINASYISTEAISTFNNNSSVANNRTYTTLSPNIQWRWSDEVSFDLSYTYRQQVFENTHQSAIGNSVQLQFSYQPQINRQVK